MIGSAHLDFDRLRGIDLSKPLDPATEKRRCSLKRHHTFIGGVDGYHSHMDITSHLGTHLEFPYHFNDEWKDGMKLPIDRFLGRGVLLNLKTDFKNIKAVLLNIIICRIPRKKFLPFSMSE